jgi:hypothetical protein
METLKEKIKTLAAEQVVLKNQTKTVNLQGVRTMPAHIAKYQHGRNRIELRCLYMALGLLRGKTPEQVESKSKTPIDMDEVNALVKKYGTESVERISA